MPGGWYRRQPEFSPEKGLTVCRCRGTAGPSTAFGANACQTPLRMTVLLPEGEGGTEVLELGAGGEDVDG